MADNLVQMQHATKAAASFTQGDTSYDSDENGFISVPSQLAGFAQHHGFSVNTAEKPAPKPLTKGNGGDKKPNGKSDGKPGETEDAGGAKGGDGK